MVDFASINNQPLRGKLIEWMILHKIALKKFLIYFLILLSLLFWGYGMYGLVDWLFITGPAERSAIARLHENLVNPEAIPRPRSLEIKGITLISGTRYDAFAVIKNPNSKWFATFDYRFLIAGEETTTRQGFILPGEEKFIFDLGLQVKGKPTRATLELKNLHWKRIQSREIPDYDAYRDARLAFGISDVSYTPTLQVAGKAISRATFTVRNNSAFNYFEVPFVVILHRGGVIAGIGLATAQNLNSGEERKMDATWFDTLSGITKVEVRPELNILDSSVYSR